ncbi:MAG: hypothetical protein LC775_19955, partial [Acidobacteria bacterium]|nr:hypothetical protein [Acidobacteriota bacterium]
MTGLAEYTNDIAQQVPVIWMPNFRFPLFESRAFSGSRAGQFFRRGPTEELARRQGLRAAAVEDSQQRGTESTLMLINSTYDRLIGLL